MADDHQKTVFISYRRSASRYIARSIFEHLRAHGYDVFLDVENIDAGDFERIILGQIKARAHFLIILNAGSVKRFEETGDWLRREIEYAIDQERNVIPIMVDEFKFDNRTRKYLTGKLEQLTKFNGLHLPYDFFDEAMARLRERYLKQPIYVEVVPIPTSDLPIIERTVAQVVSQPKPTQKQLSAEEYFNRAFEKVEAEDYDGAIADFDKVIELDPQGAVAYSFRGDARYSKGDFEGAIADFDKAIALDPQDTFTYRKRGDIRRRQGDNNGAIEDYDKAIEIDPQYIYAYSKRGIARRNKGDFDGAIEDFNKAIEFDSEDAYAYINRAEAYLRRLNFNAGLRDFAKAVVLEPPSLSSLAGFVIAIIVLIGIILIVIRLTT